MKSRSKWCLIGIPDHEAVLNVGGRLGAASGPKAFRKIFLKLNSQGPVLSQCTNAGDVQGLGVDIEANHRLAAEMIAQKHKKTGLTVVIGGSHDHGFSHLLGIQQALKEKIGCINIDAHLDVRKPNPNITSGSPFFLALECGVVAPGNFIEFGIQLHCNSDVLWDYVKQKKITVMGFESLRNGGAVKGFKKALGDLSKSCDAVVVSFDLDSMSQAYAPGVSAPQAEGFNPSEILEMMRMCGENPKCVSLGIFELNPEHDVDDKTARMAATAAYHFIDSKI